MATVVLWVLGVWFNYQLAPIVSDFKILGSQVSANTIRIDHLEEINSDTNNKVTQTGEDMTKIKCYLLKEDCLK